MIIPEYLYGADFKTISNYYERKSRWLKIKAIFCKKAKDELALLKYEIYEVLNDIPGQSW